MHSFDQPAEQTSAETVASAKAAERMPVDSVLDSHSQQPLSTPNPACSYREDLAAMLVELQTNRSALKGLASWYGLFVFTGGDIPAAQWNLAAMTSHLDRLSATDCLLTSELRRYRELIQTLGGLGQPGVRPRTLRCRHDMGDKFRRVASEIRILTKTLESSLTKALEELPPRSE